MKPRLKAIRALRLNYRRSGVWAWLKGRGCLGCRSTGCRRSSPQAIVLPCSFCDGKPKRGYQRILSEPDRVTQEQEAVAEGVFV